MLTGTVCGRVGDRRGGRIIHLHPSLGHSTDTVLGQTQAQSPAFS